ncbi:hypothetical protein [Flavobacterium sp.]|uniref:hypothetical protein n=1 Tax=Flavobacterium sp. TaxID=239 RepID=UPI002603D860|nr:hypothetical protein [Flavobacterium sp.]
MKPNKIFLQTITQHIGEPITNVSQVGTFKTDGPELERICEDYYNAKLEQSGLRHFYIGKKIELILIAFFAGFVFSALFTFIIFF